MKIQWIQNSQKTTFHILKDYNEGDELSSSCVAMDYTPQMVKHSLSKNFAADVGSNFEPMRQVVLAQTVAETHQKGNPNGVEWSGITGI